MTKQRLLIAAAALSLGFSAASFAATASGGASGSASSDARMNTNKCADLTGPARDTCIQQQLNTARTPGRSESSTSREGSRTPGRSEDSASRTGTAPGPMNPSPMGAPSAGGMPKGSSGSHSKY